MTRHHQWRTGIEKRTDQLRYQYILIFGDKCIDICPFLMVYKCTGTAVYKPFMLLYCYHMVIPTNRKSKSFASFLHPPSIQEPEDILKMGQRLFQELLYKKCIKTVSVPSRNIYPIGWKCVDPAKNTTHNNKSNFSREVFLEKRI